MRTMRSIRAKTSRSSMALEGYLVDDDMKELAENEKGQTLDHTCVVFDIETTGFSPIKNRIIEIGAVRVTGWKDLDKFSTFVNPEVPIPYDIEQLISINDGMVISADDRRGSAGVSGILRGCGHGRAQRVV